MIELESHVFRSPSLGLALPYRIFVPRGCSGENRCGLLLFLHGAGERGSDNQAQLGNRALAWTQPAVQEPHPTIVVYPQCPAGTKWVDAPWDKGSYRLASTPISGPMRAVIELLASLEQQLLVDEGRRLVTGISMGGYGTWDIISRAPRMFAAAMPLCGGGDPALAPSLRDLPIWAFHGDRDPAVPVAGTREMIEALRAAGGSPRYTEYRGAGHDIWERAYQEGEALHWLLSQPAGPR